MKDDIAFLATLSDLEGRGFNQPRFASCWRHQYSIAPKAGIPLDVLEVSGAHARPFVSHLAHSCQWYIAIVREQTQRDMMARPHSERTMLQEQGAGTDMYWGYFWAEIGYVFGPSFDQLTLSQAAHAEFSAVERILARALGSAQRLS